VAITPWLIDELAGGSTSFEAAAAAGKLSAMEACVYGVVVHVLLAALFITALAARRKQASRLLPIRGA
jgi:hypothetical protein